MEPSTSLSEEQNNLGTARRIHHFRGLVGSFFTGNSSIGSQDASSSKTPEARIGLRLFYSERTEGRSQRRENVPGASRPRLFAGPFRESTAPSQSPMQPSPPSSNGIESGQPQGNHRENVNIPHHSRLPSRGERRQRRITAWTRPKHRDKPKPKRFCGGPGIRSKEARKKLVECALSAVVLIAIFVIYLALSLSSAVTGREFHVVLILILMILVIYFCHSFIRFFMIAWRPAPRYSPPAIPRRGGGLEYAQPSQPIPVILARDEEEATDMETGNRTTSNNAGVLAPPPPAYGLWRSSVKINPNLVHWQRRQETNPQQTSTENANNGNDTPNRPPSYISDDGVRYVVDLQPRPREMTMTGSSQSRLLEPDEANIHPAERPGRKW
ncbi:hypothetical protein AJ79_07673 [Helicocarpus griseus UAMH5409]|uniref:Uncharacterized protein n=1 Tax=Helicocarpus griseus UAMH5409 TaxID=1447875 RepID=A0A2B7X0L4_9EURO|nr:hypothetical protein AJ79_07673 [Helicocarpus griseus UAMH5409]